MKHQNAVGGIVGGIMGSKIAQVACFRHIKVVYTLEWSGMHETSTIRIFILSKF